MVFPSDIDSEIAAIQNRVLYALNEYAMFTKQEIKGKSVDVVREVVEVAERTKLLRITWKDISEKQEEESSRDIVMEEQMNAQNSVKGKGTLLVSTPPTSSIRTQRELGTSSSRMDPEIREMFDIQQLR
jgi:hypothetical protein